MSDVVWRKQVLRTDFIAMVTLSFHIFQELTPGNSSYHKINQFDNQFKLKHVSRNFCFYDLTNYFALSIETSCDLDFDNHET